MNIELLESQQKYILQDNEPSIPIKNISNDFAVKNWRFLNE